MIAWTEADRKLREVAQLWSLGRRLPHVPTESERQLLLEFDAFARAELPLCSREAAIAGLRALWQRQDLGGILRSARKLPAPIRRDREVRTYSANARRLVGAVRKRHQR
jgi:hypothetical protein